LQQWADEVVELPPALTAGKGQLTIVNTFVSSDGDFTEFRYDVASEVGGEWTRTDVVDVGRNHPGDALIHNYAITLQNWNGTRFYRYPQTAADQQQLIDSDAVLADARLRITFDGETTVSAPIGEFFGSGIGEYDTRSLMFSMDTAPDGWYSAWWPMPYAEGAVIEIVNGSGVPIAGGTLEVTSAADPTVAPRLDPGGDLGYFHATSDRGVVPRGRDWVFVDTQGRGVYYGATHSLRGLIASGNRRSYLEGDERVYVDGSPTPALHGTGTEDFYESAWYFSDSTTFNMPFSGLAAYELDGDGCLFDCSGTFRIFVTDAIPFGSSLRFSIEHGPFDNNAPADYSSTAYWYGQRTYALRQTDVVDVTDDASRAAHDYTTSVELQTPLSSTYEGDDDTILVDRGISIAGSPVTFRVTVDGDNAGVRLLRLTDQAQPYQAADVLIDGQPAGRWIQALGNETSRWLEDAFEIPAALAAGKRSLEVELVPVDGAASPWKASRYEAISHVPPFADAEPPTAVTALLAATAGDTNAIDLRWERASDDAVVARYEVYAAQTPSVPIGPDTLVGVATTTGFRHSGLGLGETWYYVVRAVDGAGKAGDPSGTAMAQTGNTVLYEAEDLLPPTSASAPAEAQDNSINNSLWSNNTHLWFRSTQVNDTITLTFTVPNDGTYDFATLQTQSSDYGDIVYTIDGAPIGLVFLGFHSSVIASDWIHHGSVSLTAGAHQLTLTVVDKQATSSGYAAGIDLIRLIKTN
jgi:hypothetical protein